VLFIARVEKSWTRFIAHWTSCSWYKCDCAGNQGNSHACAEKWVFPKAALKQMNFQRVSQKESSLTTVSTDAGMEGGTRVSHCREIDLWAHQVLFCEKRESYCLFLTKSSCALSAESSDADITTTEIFFYKPCFAFSVDFPELHWTVPIQTFPDVDP